MIRAPFRNRIRAWMAGFATENLGLKVVSLALAVAIWAWLQSEQVVERRARARIRYNWPTDLVRVDEVPRDVYVTVSGPQGRVRALERRKLAITVDVSDADEGPLSIDYTDQPLSGLPDGLQVVQISPPVIDTELDKRLARTVRVEAAVIGEPADGWLKEEVRVTPKTVQIEGPQSVIRTIAKVTTDVVDISGARSNRNVRSPLVLTHKAVQPTSEEPVQIFVEIKPIIDDRTLTAVPVVVKAPGWTTEAESARVTFKGPRVELSKLREAKVRLNLQLPTVEVGAAAATVVWRRGDDGLVQVEHGLEEGVIEVIDVDPPSFTLAPEP